MFMRIFTVCIFLLTSVCMEAQNDSTQGVAKLLSLSLEELMNIKVVTASGFLQTTSEAPSTITVISSQEISERGYEQLEDALRDVPGIDLIHVNGYVPTLIYFRGMYGAENQRALLMIDGIVENNILGSNDMAGPAYSLQNVDRIEIIWGPVSALYGANAFGGVINIITKKGADINGIHAEKGFGSFNTSFENVDMGLKKGKFEFAISGSLYSTDGPRFTNRDPYYSASYVDKAYSLNTTVSYYSKNSKTTFGYRTYRTPMGWGTYSNSATTYLGLPPQGNNNLGLLGNIQRNIRGERPGLDNAYLRTWFLQNEFKANKKLDFLVRAEYRETGTDSNSYIYVTADGRKLIRVPVATYSNRVSGEISANYTISDKHRFSGGVEFFQDNVEAGQRSSRFDLTTVYLIDGRDTVVNLKSTFLPRAYDIRNNFGSYLQYVLSTSLAGKTSFTFGARYDHNSYFGNAFSPRISIVNQPSKKLTLKFQFGNAFRAPTNLEIYQTPGRNFKLEKEKIRTYEVNAIYSPSNIFRLQVNGFRNELSDVIIIGNLSGLTPDKNPGLFKITGAESIVDMAFTKTISSFVNFTYQHAWGKNLVSGASGKLPDVATVKGNVGLTLHADDDLFTISIIGNWVGQRTSPKTDPFGPVKGYFLTNCTISTKKIYKDKITASVNIHNLFNTKWLDPGFRTADGLLYSTVLEQPGINGLFKIGISL